MKREGRRTLHRALVELHYLLWSGSETPSGNAAAVFLGTLIGAQPLYGAHLALCALAARTFRLSPAKTYLAAHVNNPLTAPFLLYLSFGVGKVVFDGRWPSIAPAALREASILDAGRDLLVGSLVVGVVLGLAFGGAVFVLASRRDRAEAVRSLIDEASLRYLSCGLDHWWFVRGKIRWDPVYLEVLRSGVLSDRGRLIDLGCGRGVLLSAIRAAASLEDRGLWPAEWPPAPRPELMLGVDRSARLTSIARRALGKEAEISESDLRSFTPPVCQAITMLDSLHYLSRGEQSDLLDRAVERLAEGGVLLVREADRSPGWRFRLTRAAERLAARFRGESRQTFAFRPAQEWGALLAARGLDVTCRPASGGTPFSNVLLVATRPERAGAG